MSKPVRKQILTHQHDQWIFALRCVALVAVTQVFSTAMYWFNLSRSIQAVAERYDFKPDLVIEIMDTRRTVMVMTMLWVLPAVLVMAIWFGLRLSHRFYGVLVPVKRLMGELGRGNFGGQITLRKDDELKELGAAVNALSTELKNLNLQPRSEP